MRTIAALAFPLALAACASQQQACLSNASRELRTVELLIAETEANIQRGYGIERTQALREVPDFCFGDRRDGQIERCDRVEVRDVARPVALDLGAEQAKLDGLLERRAALESRTSQTQRACLAAYPA